MHYTPSQRRACFAIGWLSLLFVASGCALDSDSFQPRWAMSDRRYAERYSKPYRSNTLEKMARMGEEAIDARFEEGKAGFYTSAGAADQHRAVLGGEVGVFKLPTSWSTLRLGAVGMLADGLPSYLVGGVAGARVHFPTRLTPYAGVSALAGYSQLVTTTSGDSYDNNGNLVPSGTKVYGPHKGLGAIFPELGIYYWMTPNVRLGVGSSYYITTDGRDFLYSGIGLEYVPESERDNIPDRPHVWEHSSQSPAPSEPYFHTEKDSNGQPVSPATPFGEPSWMNDSKPAVPPSPASASDESDAPATKPWDE